MSVCELVVDMPKGVSTLYIGVSRTRVLDTRIHNLGSISALLFRLFMYLNDDIDYLL